MNGFANGLANGFATEFRAERRGDAVDVDMGRAAARRSRRWGNSVLATGFEANRAARCIVEIEDRISKGATGTFLLALVEAKGVRMAASFRASRKNSGSSKRDRFTTGGAAR